MFIFVLSKPGSVSVLFLYTHINDSIHSIAYHRIAIHCAKFLSVRMYTCIHISIHKFVSVHDIIVQVLGWLPTLVSLNDLSNFPSLLHAGVSLPRIEAILSMMTL